MPSEFIVDLCFIRPRNGRAYPFPDMESQMKELFSSQACCFVDRKQEEGLDIAVVEVNGLSIWTSEKEVIAHLEACMHPDSYEWLSGYQVQVIPKEDAGACCLKKRG